MAMKDSEKEEYEKQSLFKYNEDKILNSQEKEERNQRVEQLLLQDNNDKYINIKNINKNNVLWLPAVTTDFNSLSFSKFP